MTPALSLLYSLSGNCDTAWRRWRPCLLVHGCTGAMTRLVFLHKKARVEARFIDGDTRQADARHCGRHVSLGYTPEFIT